MAATIFNVILGYLLIGVAVAMLIQAVFLTKLDPRTAGAGFLFRLLIFPGLVLLWPLALARALRGGPGEGSTSTSEQ